MSSLERCLFLIGLFVFLILSCMSCLYILEINPLSVTSFAYKLKVCGNPASGKSTGVIFSNSICSLHVSVSHFGDYCNISNFFIIIVFVMVICDQ